MIDSSHQSIDRCGEFNEANACEFETSQALAFWLSHQHCVIVWRDGPQRLRPADTNKRITDLRPGDAVCLEDGDPQPVLSMSVYR